MHDVWDRRREFYAERHDVGRTVGFCFGFLKREFAFRIDAFGLTLLLTLSQQVKAKQYILRK